MAHRNISFHFAVALIALMPFPATSHADVITTNTLWPEGVYNMAELVVQNGATLEIAGGSTLTVSGAITVIGNSTMLLGAKNTDAKVGGQWAGVGVAVTAGSVSIESGSAIRADGQGYASHSGPGAGAYEFSFPSGGAYGGRGADGANDIPGGWSMASWRRRPQWAAAAAIPIINSVVVEAGSCSWM